jgi:hypothetical protein
VAEAKRRNLLTLPAADFRMSVKEAISLSQGQRGQHPAQSFSDPKTKLLPEILILTRMEPLATLNSLRAQPP